ncbi:hypothetical protein AJ80_04888 [Polytolypa hystricis UAMH7299]|uniref:Rap-GAP domain-containing protein n=1 Tax=Polytolypa hystricis (strain UAMH7299) TaxID=1447883 RepID=A0A2B7Y6W0_POLH7|nr:hypothetical protein AJ80_04888 [Polytolypa hystricis UAMH7299]
MSPGDVPPPSQHKPSSSTFADVFKTLANARPKSQSPVSHGSGSGDALPPEMEGRRGSRVTFGFESLHRGSAGFLSPDAQSPPSLDSLLSSLAQQPPSPNIQDEVDNAVRFLAGFSGEQALAIWEAGSHLIESTSSEEAHKAGASLLEAIASRQDLSSPARRTLFLSISHPCTADTIPARVNSLISLTDHGRKLEFADSPILPVIAAWISPLYESVNLVRSKRRKTQRSNSNSSDESTLGSLFQLVIDIITLQRHPPTSSEIELLLDEVVSVCRKTPVAADIKNSLAIFDAIITSSEVPDASVEGLINVLCSIQASVKSLSGPTSRVVRNLAKSKKQAEMVENLHTFLLESTDREDRNLNVIRGAVDIFRDLLVAYGQGGMPDISFDHLISSLKSAAQKNDGRTHTDILDVCSCALHGDYATIALEHSWSEFVQVLIACSSKVIDAYSQPSTSKPSSSDDVRLNISANITRVLSSLESLWSKMDRQQKLDALHFAMAVYNHTSPAQSDLVFDLCKTEQLCYPGHPEWKTFCWDLVHHFILARDKHPEVRIHALNTLRDAFVIKDAASQLDDEGLIGALLENFTDERSSSFLEALVLFLVDASASCSLDTFKLLSTTLSLPLKRDEDNEEISPTTTPSIPGSRPISLADSAEHSLSSISSAGLVRIFLRTFCQSPSKASIAFERLIDIAQSSNRPTDCRLNALKLLFRLRCDSTGAIHVISASENEFLIAVLCRTMEVGSRGSTSEEVTPERAAKIEEGTFGATARSSLKEPASGTLSTSSVRATAQLRTLRWTPPAWTHSESKGLPEDPPICTSLHTFAYSNEHLSELAEKESFVTLKFNLWLEAIIALLQREKEWDVYSYVLAHLGPQLVNRDIFQGAVPQIKLLRSVLCEQIKNESFLEPLAWTGVKKADVAICIFDSLTMLISFHHHFAKSEQDELVRTFMLGIGSWEGASRGCIHALSVCCHEIPLSVTKALNAILDKMSKIVTQSHVAVHILEFLALLARLPAVYVNLRDEEIRTVFGVCLRFIQTSREQRYKAMDSSGSRSGSISSRQSGGTKEQLLSPTTITETPDSINADDLSRYVYSLTYHVMIFWFLSLKLQDRINHVNWITKRLIFTDEHGKEVIEEQSQVFIDFMQRVAFSDLGDTIPFDKFPPSESDGPVSKKSWIVGMSIITVETAGATGLTQITKRQASGTTYAIYQQRTAPVLPHQIPPSPGSYSLSDDTSTRTAIFPSHVLLQMTASAFPTPISLQPIPLHDDDFTRRALSIFDRNDIVDGHKVGVIFIDDGQTEEKQILANTTGSADYDFFLSGLGTKVSIRDVKFNTQGLHPDVDGEFTYAWRDRVTEIIYHVATMMPTNLEVDPQFVNKKRHIGNDFVNIIFNRSNQLFDFNTIPSQFNFVNIVISPVCRIASPSSSHGGPCAHEDCKTYNLPDFNQAFYVVKVMSKSDFPELSAAAIPKVISGKDLTAFVRLIALNASVFSLVSSRGGGEHISSWQNRLREIRRLRERAVASSDDGGKAGAGEGSFLTNRRNTRSNVHQPPEEGSHTGLRANFGAEWSSQVDNNVFKSMDFSRWSR